MSYKDENQRVTELIKDISNHIGMELNPDSFCILPWIHFSTMTQGEIKLCCRGQPPKKPADGYDTYNGQPHVQSNNFDLKEYWNSEYLQDIRNKLAKGERISQCKNCWKMEDREILSLRQTRIIDWEVDGSPKDYLNNMKDWVETGVTPFKVPIIELKLSNLCNYKCRMCWPKDSSLWATDWERVSKFYDEETQTYINKVHDIAGNKRLFNLYDTNETFVERLVELMDHVEEIEFAGGEPLLDPIHYRVLSNIKNPENVTLKYSTNLSKMELGEHKVIDLWEKFKDIKLTISIDGDKELNTYIRRGSDWELLKENIKIVKERIGHKISKLKGTTCISAFNAKHLDKTAEAIIMELGIQWHTSRLQYPEFQHANVLPIEELQKSVDNLYVTRQKIVDLDLGKAHRFNIIHIDNAINWLESCIKDNKNKEDKYNRFLSFNRELDDN
jgi:sulfatase maturation enzyme AslB (radical SAM superfamily)